MAASTGGRLLTEKELRETLRALGNAEIASHSLRFFKTQPGEYGAGDEFLGIRVPVLRRLAKQFQDTPLSVVWNILASRYHEERFVALLILVRKYERGDSHIRSKIFTGYLDRTQYVNNWDLVDSSAPAIVGGYLLERDRSVLYRLAASDDLWERRIAVLACFPFVKNSDFTDLIAIVEGLLQDPEDLVHKACGWMLRETGKRDLRVLEDFLNRFASAMPRTMLRTAIEKFPPQRRSHYMSA